MTSKNSATFLGLIGLLLSSNLAWGDLRRIDLESRENDSRQWSTAGNGSAFCFKREKDEAHCYPLSQMPEYNLIVGGELNPIWLQAFTKEQQNLLLEDFSLLRVRFLATGPAANGLQPFVVHLMYAGFPEIPMTLFVFGTLKLSENGEVQGFELQEFTDSRKGEALLRKMVIGWNQTDAKTGAIIQFVVQSVLGKYFGIPVESHSLSNHP